MLGSFYAVTVVSCFWYAVGKWMEKCIVSQVTMALNIMMSKLQRRAYSQQSHNEPNRRTTIKGTTRTSCFPLHSSHKLQLKLPLQYLANLMQPPVPVHFKLRFDWLALNPGVGLQVMVRTTIAL